MINKFPSLRGSFESLTAPSVARPRSPVSIPQRKFRKSSIARSPASWSSVSIPQRKFRKPLRRRGVRSARAFPSLRGSFESGMIEAGNMKASGFHPSEEVSKVERYTPTARIEIEFPSLRGSFERILSSFSLALILLVSIPQRKFRKQKPLTSNSNLLPRFHPSEEVSKESSV